MCGWGFVLWLVMGMSVAVFAEEPMPDFTTDRPGVGDSPMLVPPGYLQFEPGITIERDVMRKSDDDFFEEF